MGIPHIQLPPSGMAGEYRIVARKADSGEERVLADWFSNLITDIGLNNIVNNGWKAWCHVGTGTNAPAEADASLQTPVASTAAISNSVTSNAGAPSYYSQASIDYTFPVGAGTYTEVGVSNKAHTDGTQLMFSRARIVDGSGNPTSITVLADEFLVVTYRIRIYPPLTDVSGTISIGSDVYNYTIRAANITNFGRWGNFLQNAGWGFSFNSSGNYLQLALYSGALAAVTTLPSGVLGSSPSGKFTNVAYIDGSYQVLGEVIAVFESYNSAGFIRSISWVKQTPSGTPYRCGEYQLQFFPDVPKNVNIQLTFTLGMGWGRYVAP